MYRGIWFSSLVALLLIGSSACEDVAGDRGINIESKGAVLGTVFVDRNGNGVFDSNIIDGFAQNISVRLTPRGGGTSTVSSTSDAQGAFRLGDVPVGEYDVRIETSSVPDSLRFIKIDSASVHVLAGGSPHVVVMLSYPTVLVRDARASAAGKRVFIEGVTLNALATFGDSTVHVADSTGVIRATRVITAGVTTNTRVRILGTTGSQNGQPTISDVTAFALTGAGVQPTPPLISTNLAAKADGGKLEANLVQVSGALIVGSQTNAALDVILSVNDGSGLLDVVIDRQTGIPTASFVPGATLTATGLLVPTATAGVFQLKPRTTADATATFSTFTVAEARALPAGRAVTIDGVALNSWFVFADSTVHINDATGSLRATRVAPINLFAGDRIRLLGTLFLQNGQPILTNVSATVLGIGVLPLPQVITTAKAATADAGKLDAAFVKIIGGTISAVTTVANDIFLTVNDSTGPVEVMLDKDIGFATAPFVMNAVVNVTGVLVTKAGGVEWRLKPRQPGDVIVR